MVVKFYYIIDKTGLKCYDIYMTKANGKAKILVSNTQLSGFNHIVDAIKHELDSDKNQEFILVVPDKFSMNAEQIFMERTGLSSVFNVWITTLSRLVSKVVGEETQEFKLLTKNSGVMLVSKIILENSNKLSSYKKVADDYRLAETIYNAINLLKSSGVLPADLKNNFSQSSFGMKMKDLYLIYSEYEKNMKNNLDVITRLQIFDQKVKNDNYIKNSKIYFAMFDSFTNIQINSLCGIAKHCKDFCISLCANTYQNNSYIYDNTLLHKIKDTFKEFNVDSQITNINSCLTPLSSFLAENLFSIKPTKKFESQQIRLAESDFVENEARYVASRIKFLVMEKGYLFDDINVAINGFEKYTNSISNIFGEYDLPFYLDKQRKMTDHFLVKTILKISRFLRGETSLNNILSIVKSPIFEIEYQKKCDFDNYCQKYGVFGAEILKPFFTCDSTQSQNAEEVRKFVFDGIGKLKDNFDSRQNVLTMCTYLTDYIKQIYGTKFENNSQLHSVLQNRIDEEAYKKFINIISDSANMFGDTEMSVDMFFDMLENSLASTNLLTVPAGCDSIFVGDASTSTFYPRKILFVMGATQSQMPSYKTSSGAITDDEIENFVATKRISPTLADLNKREKFKLFNLVLLPSDLLEISYSTILAGETQQKSEFITALQKIITQNEKNLDITKINNVELELSNKSNANFPIYLIGTLQNAVRISKSKDSKIKYIINTQFRDIVKSQTDKFAETEDRFDIANAKTYIFKKQTTSISQIEKYFRCPFMQFVTYAISPQEKEKFEIKTNIVGIILHKIAEEFVRYCINHNYIVNDVEVVAKKIYRQVVDSKDFEVFKSNKYLTFLLEQEAIRFCKAILHQIKSTDFKPSYTEYRFKNYNLGDINFSGVVDRIDVCKSVNCVRIIDYKSGSDKFSFKDIYYGLKLQLIAYLKIISEQFNLKMSGAFYMPIKNKFSDINSSEFKSYKLDGIVEDDVNIIKHHDTNLIENTTSDILPLQLNSDGSLNKRSAGQVLSKDQFDEIIKYTFEIINNAVDEMLSGFIQPKPYVDNKNPCDYCQFKALCHFEYNKKGFRELSKKDKNSFKPNKPNK